MTINTALKKYFGYGEYRPGQQEVIESIIAGKNVLAVMPTGGGKSICFQIPAILTDTFAIVISPLIALMKDQVDSANKLENFAGFINSTIEYNEQEKVLTDVSQGAIKLLYLSPEKLESVQFAEKIKMLKPQYLFVDEAHCISEWGHNFRPSYRKITSFAEFTGINKISAFTATATPEVRDDIIRQLNMEEPEIYVSGFNRDNIKIGVIRSSKKKEKGLELLNRLKAPAIIYSATRRFAEEFNDHLRINGFNSAVYHAGLAPDLRKMIQDDFIKGNINYIVATNAFGMGIDKSNIRTIVHLHMPGSIENYYQEIGRAGRDGLPSEAWLLFSERDIGIHKYFIENSNPGYEIIENVYNTVCNYYKIAVGSSSEKKIILNTELLKLLDVRGVNKSVLSSSLKILESSGYIRADKSKTGGYKFRYLMINSELKKFVKRIASRDLKMLIVHLLRRYGGDPFFKKVTIDPESDAEITGIPLDNYFILLDNLMQTGIIELEEPALGDNYYLTGTRVKAGGLYLDLSEAGEYEQRMLSKLDMMTAFCYTDECRMSYILKYFGDSTAEKCNNCDNCKQKELPSTGSDFIRDKILHLLNEINISIKTRDVISILKTGKSRRRLVSSYALSCSHFKTDEIEDAVNYLSAGRYVKIFNDIIVLDEKGKDYLALEIPDKAENDDQDILYEKKIVFFEKLKELRAKIAKRFNQPERMIISDDVINNIVSSPPSDKESLLAVKGFNQRMFNKCGNEILDLSKEFAAKNNAGKGKQEKLPETLSDTYQLLSRKKSIKDIADKLNLPETIISIQIETILQYDKKAEIAHLFESGLLERINSEILKGHTKLTILKQQLPDIPYSLLRIALAAKSNQDLQF